MKMHVDNMSGKQAVKVQNVERNTDAYIRHKKC